MPKYRFIEITEVHRIRAFQYEIEADSLSEAQEKWHDTGHTLDHNDSWWVTDADYDCEWSGSTLVHPDEDNRKVAKQLCSSCCEIDMNYRGAGFLTRDQIDEILTGGKEAE